MGQHAPAPSRATVNLTLGFGLVSVPIQLFKATDETKPVERKQFTRAGNPVGYKKYDTKTGKDISNDDVVMMTEHDGTWVELTDAEIALVTAGLDVERHNVPIECFVPLSSIGTQYVADTSRLYQARPAPLRDNSGRSKGPNPGAVKALALLLVAMAERQVAALFRVSLRGAARYAVLLPSGHVQFLFYTEELREERELLTADINDKEMAAAFMLMGDAETPELEDGAKVKIAEFVANKIKDADFKPVLVVDEPEGAEVIDLLAALEASVAKKAA